MVTVESDILLRSSAVSDDGYTNRGEGRTDSGASTLSSSVGRALPSSKVSLYEHILKQLEDDGLADVAHLLADALGLKTNALQLPCDALYTLYERALFDPACLFSQRDAKTRKIAAHEKHSVHRVGSASPGFMDDRASASGWVAVAARSVPSSTATVSSRLGQMKDVSPPTDQPPALPQSQVRLDGEEDSGSLYPAVSLNAEEGVLPPLTNAQEIWSTIHKDACTVVALSPNGCFAASGGSDNTVRVMVKQQPDGGLAELIPPDERHAKDDRKKYGVGSSQKIWTRVFQDHQNTVTALTFSPDNRFLISGGKDSTIKLYEPNKPKHRRALHTLRDFSVILSLAVHPTGSFLYCGTAHSAIRCYDLATLECFTAMRPADQHTNGITALTCSDDGCFLVSASLDGSIQVWDARSTQRINKLATAHSGFEVVSVALSNNQRYLLSGGGDGKARLWDLRNGRQVQLFTGTENIGYTNDSRAQAVFLSDDRYVACIWDNPDTDVTFFNIASGDFVNRIHAHPCQVTHIASQRRTNAILTAGSDFRCRYLHLSATNQTHSGAQGEELNICL